MGANLCCLIPSIPNQHEQHTWNSRDRVASNCVETVPDLDHTIVFPKEVISSAMVEILTLYDILLASPERNSPCIITGNDHGMIKQLPNKIFVSPDLCTEFFTPRSSFSSGEMWKIEGGEEDELSASAISQHQSGNLEKKVRFTLPVEADIVICYSPGGGGIGRMT